MSDPRTHRTLLWLRADRAMGLEAEPVSRPARRPPVTPAPIAQASPATRKPAAPAPPAPGARPAPTPAAPVPAAPAPPAAAPVLFDVTAPFTTPPPSRQEKLRLLAELDATQVRECRKCRLCGGRTQTVFGEGDVDCRLMFVGEGPGEDEDRQGRPFVGRAGRKLEEMIAAMGLQRSAVYIGNVVKCRPPDNRTPLPDEVAACRPYVFRQIEIIRPHLLVALGLTATRALLDSKLTMSRLRGTWQAFRGINVMPTFHPSYILRNYTQETRRAVWEDLQKVMAALGLPGRGVTAGEKSSP